VHRALASRWIGQLHRCGTGIAAASRLREAGPARYLAHLHAARARIRRNFANPAFTEEDRAALLNVLAAQDRIPMERDRVRVRGSAEDGGARGFST
jgi:hypothetical protein